MKRRWWKSRLRLRLTVIFCGLVVLTQIAPPAALYRWTSFGDEFSEEFARAYRGMATGFIPLVCAVYGFVRVATTHPASRAKLEWLFSTPWTDRKPLPFGSPLPDWLDLPFMMLSIAFFASDSMPWYVPVTVTLFFWSVAMALGSSDLAEPASGYAAILATPLIVRWWMYPIVTLGVVVALAFVEALYFHRLLRLYSADGPVIDRASRFLVQHANRRKFLGWPHDVLPTPEALGKDVVRVRAAILVFSPLVMYTIYWLMDAQADFIEDPEVKKGQGLFYCFACSAAIGWRLFVYCYRYWPPVGVLGRLLLGRPIIPGYDRVFLAPLLAIATAAVAPLLLYAIGLPPRWLFPISTMAVLAIVLYAPPSLADWRLTGAHRILNLGGPAERKSART